MRLGFMLYPESDLRAGVDRWRRYGFLPLWWPDQETVILGAHPGAVTQVMLEDHQAEHRLGAGPVFIVDSVDGYRSEHADLDWAMEPCDVPAGRYAAFTESDHPVRVLDLSGDLGEHRDLFAAWA